MSGLDRKAAMALAENARTELSVAAQAAEQRNRPRLLIVLAGAVLLGSVIYALTGVSARADAFSKVAAARARADKFARAVAELNALRLTQTQAGLQPDPRMASKIEAAAKRFGLKLAGPVSDTDTGTAVGGLSQKMYRARVANQDPSAVLKWLAATQQPDMGGLEIYTLNIHPPQVAPLPANRPATGTGAGAGAGATPEAMGNTSSNWSVDVDFVRWEKK